MVFLWFNSIYSFWLDFKLMFIFLIKESSNIAKFAKLPRLYRILRISKIIKVIKVVNEE